MRNNRAFSQVGDQPMVFIGCKMFIVNHNPWRVMGETDSAYVMLLSLSVVIGSQENSARQYDRSTHKRLPVIRSDEQIRTQAIFFMNIFPFLCHFFLSSTSYTYFLVTLPFCWCLDWIIFFSVCLAL